MYSMYICECGGVGMDHYTLYVYLLAVIDFVQIVGHVASIKWYYYSSLLEHNQSATNFVLLCWWQCYLHDFLPATPGRLNDLVMNDFISLRSVTYLVSCSDGTTCTCMSNINRSFNARAYWAKNLFQKCTDRFWVFNSFLLIRIVSLEHDSTSTLNVTSLVYTWIV